VFKVVFKAMSKIFYYPRRVEFCETDAARIVHFSSMLQYAEQAEHALLRSLGTTVFASPGERGSSSISWPRVRVECDFHGAAHFEDELTVAVRVARLGTKSVTYAFRVSRATTAIASIVFTNVCCRVDDSAKMESIEIPTELRSRLVEYQAADFGAA
jgi:4-hydroxybenzoyl-CoA thioesterase/acyl-CoA thioester hydrolase